MGNEPIVADEDTGVIGLLPFVGFGFGESWVEVQTRELEFKELENNEGRFMSRNRYDLRMPFLLYSNALKYGMKKLRQTICNLNQNLEWREKLWTKQL